MINDAMSYGWLWLLPLTVTVVTVGLAIRLVRWLFPQGEGREGLEQQSNLMGEEPGTSRD